jgi:glycosyltransferase involved in cell wall biosynthesis
MNIGIDARLLDGDMTGISRYLWNLIKYIPRYDKENKYFLFSFEGIDNFDKSYKIITIKKTKLPKQLFSHYWLNFILPKLLDKNRIDIFFTPYILVPLRKGKYKNLIVIHDSMPKLFKEYYTFYYRKYMDFILPLVIKRSDAILTVSESARQDIIKIHSVPPDKISYMHLWTDENYRSQKFNSEERISLLKKFNLPDKFILYVGAIEERKNIQRILEISDILISRNIAIKFVLVGSPGYGFKGIIDKIQMRSDRIIYLKYVEENDLPTLYNLATLFLFPSHYEGFGLPPLEAMKCGLPVLSSNNSSLTEVVGEGGLMFRDNDSTAFADAIISLLSDENFYQKQKAKALTQAEKFTPQKQIIKYLDVIKKLSQ